MEYHPRSLAQVIRRALGTFPAVLVTGARQTGKTSLLRNEFPGHRYLSLDQPDVRLRAAADPAGFLLDHPPPLVLDELQHVPELLPYLKARIDEDRSPGRFLLTGSQKLRLMRGVSESLAGRVAVLELDPFSVRELAPGRASEPLDSLLERVFGEGPPSDPGAAGQELADWLLRGGYPEPRLNPAVDRRLWFSSYVQTYLERDIRDLVQVADLNAYGRFLALVAARSGGLLNAAELGREVGVTAPTIQRWLSVLETTHVLHLLPPFHRNLGKRLRKAPKLHLLDCGLLAYLLGLQTAEQILQGPSLGGLTECAVVAEWLKAFRQAGERASLSHWRSAAGDEVDLVFERGERIYAVEVKATASPTPHHAEGLRRFLALAGPTARGVLACRVERPVHLLPGIRAVPWHLAW
ncbi:MAG TPA: ATP-binding protein [Myxococcota bacterium]|nr:ATP-binding protein [Myxococcota bacterium]HRY93656.1 ATP-binding protein [Myxococcota bacterium]HSA20989.1 ATP-binding protein [Myxococcota bacterium]